MHLIPKVLNSEFTNETIEVTKLFLNPACNFASNIKRIFKSKRECELSFTFIIYFQFFGLF